MADGRWQVAGGRWQVADDRIEIADGRWQVAGGRWQMARATPHQKPKKNDSTSSPQSTHARARETFRSSGADRGVCAWTSLALAPRSWLNCGPPYVSGSNIINSSPPHTPTPYACVLNTHALVRAQAAHSQAHKHSNALFKWTNQSSVWDTEK